VSEASGARYQVVVAGVVNDVVRAAFAELEPGWTTATSTVVRLRSSPGEGPGDVAERLRARGLVLLSIRTVSSGTDGARPARPAPQSQRRPRPVTPQPITTDSEARAMATMTVWKFDDAQGAEEASRTLTELQKEGLITVVDAAIVTWPAGTKKPKTEQKFSTTKAGALGGSFWGLLFGLIFFVPLLGLAVGAATGALAGSMSDVGIDDDFIKKVRAEVTPGTSALFVMTSDAVLDKVHDAFAATHPTLIHTNLSAEQDAKLREVFATA
jgi:uncharacterized membrane protein